MADSSSSRVGSWLTAVSDLGIEVTAPFDLRLPSGTSVQANLLVKDFGARNGMVVVTDYDAISNHVSEIIGAGFGYSVMSLESSTYDRETTISVLSDWGWSGSASGRPEWLDDARIDNFDDEE